MSPALKSIHCIDDAAWDAARRRCDVLRPIAETMKKSTGTLDVAHAAAALGVSVSHAYRLIRRLRREKTVSALLMHRPGPDKGNRRLPDTVEQIIDCAIKAIWLQKEKPTIKGFYRQVRSDCATAGHMPPCLNTVRSRLTALSLEHSVRKREGVAAAEARFRQILGSLEASTPLEIVQIDHTKVDIMLVDDVTRASIGRPWLTLVMDVHTRMVLGFLLSLEAPGASSVALSLSHAVLSKDTWRAERLVEHSWPTEGLPACIHVDNGAEFHSRAFERGCAQHGIRILYRPPATPRYGGHIERLMGTLMHRIHALPGSTFSNVEARGAYPSEERACLSFREFERIFALEVLGPYHNEVHRVLGATPAAKWSQALKQREPRRPPNAQAFMLDFLPFEERVVRRDGVRLFNIQYQDGGLAHLLGQTPDRLRVKYDPRNLSTVFVELPDGDHVRVPYADLRREPITLWEHREALRRLREEGRRTIDEHAIFSAIREQRDILDTARHASRQARRSVVRREVAHGYSGREGSSEPPKGAPTVGNEEAHVPMPPPGADSGVEIW